MAKILVFYPFSIKQVHHLQKKYAHLDWVFAMDSQIKDFPPKELEDVYAFITDRISPEHLQLFPNLHWLHVTNPVLDLSFCREEVPIITRDLELSESSLQYIVGWMLKKLILDPLDSELVINAGVHALPKQVLIVGDRMQSRQIALKFKSLGWVCWYASIRKTFDSSFSHTVTVNEISSILPKMSGLIIASHFYLDQTLVFKKEDFQLFNQDYALISLSGFHFTSRETLLEQVDLKLTSGVLVDSVQNKQEINSLVHPLISAFPGKLTLENQSSSRVFQNFQRNLVSYLSNDLSK